MADVLRAWKSDLYDHQVDFALRNYDRYNRGEPIIITHDMGSGKTLSIVSALYLMLRNAPDRMDILIFVPSVTMIQWMETLNLIGDIANVQRYDTQFQKVFIPLESNPKNIIVVPVHLLNRNISKYIFQDREWDVIVCDEVQSINTQDTNTNRNIKRIGARHRIAASATPLTKHWKDLSVICDWLYPNENILKSDLPYILEFVKSRDLIHNKFHEFPLPEIEYIKVDVTASESEIGLCHSIIDRPNQLWLGLVQKYWQALCDPRGVAKSMRLPTASLPENGCVATALIDHYMTLPDRNEVGTIIFCGYHAQVKTFLRLLLSLNVPAQELTSNISPGCREVIIENFKAGAIKVLVMTGQCGGIGLNLQVGKYMYMATIDYSPSNILQWHARCHRIGTQHDSKVFYSNMTNIENKWFERLSLKTTLSEPGHHAEKKHFEKMHQSSKFVEISNRSTTYLTKRLNHITDDLEQAISVSSGARKGRKKKPKTTDEEFPYGFNWYSNHHKVEGLQMYGRWNMKRPTYRRYVPMPMAQTPGAPINDIPETPRILHHDTPTRDVADTSGAVFDSLFNS